jgi:deoxyadenosine/deoxycytidine kinase
MLISLEGNIGSGKTTFLRILGQRLGDLLPGVEIIVVQEPVEDWLVEFGETGSILGNLGNDVNRWAMTFQHNAFITMFRLFREHKAKERTTNQVVIFERSVFSSRKVFAEVLHERGSMNEMEWAIYLDWFHYFAEEICFDGHIYLRTDVNECCQRARERGREADSSLPRDYLHALETRHDEWLMSEGGATTPRMRPIPVLKVDGHQPFHQDEPAISGLLDQIVGFVKDLQDEIMLEQDIVNGSSADDEDESGADNESDDNEPIACVEDDSADEATSRLFDSLPPLSTCNIS